MSDYTDRIHPTQSGISSYLEDLMKKKYQIPTFQKGGGMGKRECQKTLGQRL